jgi:hypothetical protein
MPAFNITTNNYIFSTDTPQTFDCFLRSGGANISIYVNNTSTPSTLPSNTNFNFINLSDVNYFRLSSSQNFNLICAYQATKQYSDIIVEATTTLPAEFNNLPYLIYVLGGLFLFFLALFFIDFLRRSIR